MADSSSLKSLIVPGIIAVLGTVIGGMLTGYLNIRLEREKYQSQLILKALESSSADDRLNSLKMMVHTNLIKESDIRNGVDSYIVLIEKHKITTAQIVPPNASVVLEPPITTNTRVYLLSGKKSNDWGLDSLQTMLVKEQYTVLGKNTALHDAERPAGFEVRYFNAVDSMQAVKLSNFLMSKYKAPFPVSSQKDQSAKPGYIEIWFGR